MSVHRKLMDARIKLQNMQLNKSGHNKFAGYRYFELGDFLPAIQTIFNDIGLCGCVSFRPDIASLIIIDIDDPTSLIEITSPMSTADMKGCQMVQNLGAVQTYIRRYLWVTAMEIVEHDALDSTTGKKEVFKSEPMTEWDKLDEETKNWMLNEAMAVTVMLNDGDVAGAVSHIESLKLDDSYKIAFWSRFDSKQKSAMKKHTTEQRKANV